MPHLRRDYTCATRPGNCLRECAGLSPFAPEAPHGAQLRRVRLRVHASCARAARAARCRLARAERTRRPCCTAPPPPIPDATAAGSLSQLCVCASVAEKKSQLCQPRLHQKLIGPSQTPSSDIIMIKLSKLNWGGILVGKIDIFHYYRYSSLFSSRSFPHLLRGSGIRRIVSSDSANLPRHAPRKSGHFFAGLSVGIPTRRIRTAWVWDVARGLSAKSRVQISRASENSRRARRSRARALGATDERENEMDT